MLVYTEFSLKNSVLGFMQNSQRARYRYGFESFGVKIGIESNNESFLKKIVGNLPQIIPNGNLIENTGVTDHNFLFDTDGKIYSLSKDSEDFGDSESEENSTNFFFGRLRQTVAEFAVGKVFLHAGVVGWKEKAIVIPGNSFSGKTTLVAELIKRGAVYYSDEYAILDEQGRTYPFPKTLSIRGVIDEYKQIEVAPETFGGIIGSEPLPVGLVFITEYEDGAEWSPEVLSAGNGVMEILPHTIPIRYNTKFSLQVLNNLANRAIIAKSKRGDAQEVVNLLLRFLESDTI